MIDTVTREARAALVRKVEDIMELNLYNPCGDGWIVGGISGTAEKIVDALLASDCL